MDITRATEVTQEVSDEVDVMFAPQKWNADQKERSEWVREALSAAVKAVIGHCPPCADRSAAIRAVREARMWALSAISHGGKY
jgi:hypothetical protein